MNNNNKNVYEWIDVNKLSSAALDYQRKIDMDFVRAKIAKFDASKVRTPAISIRINKDNKEEYKIVDGQHTVSIVRGIGWTRIKCLVKRDLTTEEENAWFYEINDPDFQRTQKAGKLLNSKIDGRFDINTNILVDSLEEIGYTIKTSTKRPSNGVINAGVTIQNIFKSLGKDDFKKCLELHNSAWRGDKKALTSYFLNGMKKFYFVYKNEIDPKRFVQAFYKKGITGEDIAKEVNKLELKRDNSTKYAWVLVQKYNVGLNDSRRLKFSKLED